MDYLRWISFQVLILQDKIEEKDREVQRLKNELQQKNLEDEDLMQKWQQWDNCWGAAN